jgi:hypothetical protein
MSDDVNLAIASLTVGLTRTLALICNQLVASNFLDRELLLADLAHLELLLGSQNDFAGTVPKALGVALRQGPDLQP